jgi:DNA-binding response OmpR family regulator
MLSAGAIVTKILVVEDERDICNLIRAHLEAEGHSVFQAFDGREALAIVTREVPNLVILDWMLPGLDGLAVCRRIRQEHLMPIIMLTARGEEVDRVLGLEVGADDYVVKPFSIRELMARVRATLRRVALDSRTPAEHADSPGPIAHAPTPAAVPATPPPLVCGPLRVDPETHTASLAGAMLDLTPKEYDLVLLLVSHPGRAFSRDFLLERLWGSDYDGFDRVVDTHVARLRKKLGPVGERIVPVRGVGYRLGV